MATMEIWSIAYAIRPETAVMSDRTRPTGKVYYTEQGAQKAYRKELSHCNFKTIDGQYQYQYYPILHHTVVSI